MKKCISRLVFLTVIFILFFLPFPRTDREANEFIVNAQITFPLPDETIGLPTMVEDENGKRGISILHENGEYKSKTLKISKKEGKYYWSSWKGQRLNVVRGHYYITDVGLASTTFISADGDGMVFIFNPIISPIILCRKMAAVRHHVYETEYMEVRTTLGKQPAIIRGKMKSMFYPDGFAEKLCAGKYEVTPPLIYYKPSFYKRIKNYLFKNNISDERK